MDDFESSATKESLTVGDHKVYSLYMEPRQGYRLARPGDGMPRGGASPRASTCSRTAPMRGSGCAWEFGNAPPNAQTFNDTTALFHGRRIRYRRRRRRPLVHDGPSLVSVAWRLASLQTSRPAQPEQPFARGEVCPRLSRDRHRPTRVFSMSKWALKMADVRTADALTTAYQGAMAQADSQRRGHHPGRRRRQQQCGPGAPSMKAPSSRAFPPATPSLLSFGTSRRSATEGRPRRRPGRGRCLAPGRM